MKNCVFCKKIKEGGLPNDGVSVYFKPLNPVTKEIANVHIVLKNQLIFLICH